MRRLGCGATMGVRHSRLTNRSLAASDLSTQLPLQAPADHPRYIQICYVQLNFRGQLGSKADSIISDLVLTVEWKKERVSMCPCVWEKWMGCVTRLPRLSPDPQAS